MRLIDADKLYPDCLTKSGNLAISQSQLANAPTVEEKPQAEIDYDPTVKLNESNQGLTKNNQDLTKLRGDLISRKDLKEHAQKLLVGESINTYFGINLYKMFEEIIDHAPAVDVVQLELHEKILDQTISELFKCQEELEKLRNGIRSQGEWVRKVDVIQSIAKQYSEHDELVPMWLSIGNMKGDAE